MGKWSTSVEQSFLNLRQGFVLNVNVYIKSYIVSRPQGSVCPEKNDTTCYVKKT